MPDQPKTDLHLRHIVGAGTLALVTVILFGMAFGGETLSLNEWLFRWQTMIAGFAAVAAAFFTIRKMEETDRRAEDRHTGQIALQLNSERLALLRYQTAMDQNVAENLGQIHSDLNEMDEKFERLSHLRSLAHHGGDQSEARSASKEISQLIVDIRDKRDAFIEDFDKRYPEISSIIPPDVATKASALRERVKDFNVFIQGGAYDMMGEFIERIRAEDIYAADEQEISDAIARWRERSRWINDASAEFDEILRKFSGRYPVLPQFKNSHGR